MTNTPSQAGSRWFLLFKRFVSGLILGAGLVFITSVVIAGITYQSGSEVSVPLVARFWWTGANGDHSFHFVLSRALPYLLLAFAGLYAVVSLRPRGRTHSA